MPARTDGAGPVEGVWVFVHRWRSQGFDPLAVARAKRVLKRLTRLVERAGHAAEPAFGPRWILTALRMDHPLTLAPRWEGTGCTDGRLCVRDGPQNPAAHGVIALGQCQRCTRCLTVCPVGWETAQAARAARRAWI